MDALMKNINGWEKTGNVAVDMVAEFVYKSRRAKIPVRNIFLKPALYILFIEFLCKKCGEHMILSPKGQVIAPIEFDGITIQKGTIFQQNLIRHDVWPMSEKKVMAFKEMKDDTGRYPEHSSHVN